MIKHWCTDLVSHFSKYLNFLLKIKIYFQQISVLSRGNGSINDDMSLLAIHPSLISICLNHLSSHKKRISPHEHINLSSLFDLQHYDKTSKVCIWGQQSKYWIKPSDPALFSCTCSNHWRSVHLIPTFALKAHPPPNYPPTLGFPHPCLAHWQTCSQAHKTQMSRHSQHQPPACALRPTENCLPVFTVHALFTILNWIRHKICLFFTHFHSYLLWIEQLGYSSF